MASLKGAIAVVTGAGRGLGAALVMSLADAGCHVVACGRKPEALQRVCETVRRRTGGRPEAIPLDLADPSSVESAIARIAALHPVVDVVVNNGAAWLEAKSEPYAADAVLSVVNAAVSGTFLLTQGLLPLLHRSTRPDIVTIGSVNGLPNAPLQTLSVPFYAAKHGQTALAEGFRQTLAKTHVRSNCIHPPYLDDVLPSDAEWETVSKRQKGERGTSRDVVEAVIFAISRPRHVTLSSIVIDAGTGD